MLSFSMIIHNISTIECDLTERRKFIKNRHFQCQEKEFF